MEIIRLLCPFLYSSLESILDGKAGFFLCVLPLVAITAACSCGFQFRTKLFCVPSQ